MLSYHLSGSVLGQLRAYQQQGFLVDQAIVESFLSKNERLVRSLLCSVIYHCHLLTDEEAIELSLRIYQSKQNILLPILSMKEVQSTLSHVSGHGAEIIPFPAFAQKSYVGHEFALDKQLPWQMQRLLLDCVESRLMVLLRFVFGVSAEVAELICTRLYVLMSALFYHSVSQQLRVSPQEIAQDVFKTSHLSEAFLFQLLMNKDDALFTEIIWQTVPKSVQSDYDRRDLSLPQVLALLDQTLLVFTDIGKVFLETALTAYHSLEDQYCGSFEEYEMLFTERMGAMVAVVWEDLPDLLIDLLNKDPLPDWSQKPRVEGQGAF